MSDNDTDLTGANTFDRPSENLATKNTQHAPWHNDDGRSVNDTSQHRRYHSLFEDLMT